MPRVEGSIGPSAYAKRVAKRLKQMEEADSVGRTIKYLLSQAIVAHPEHVAEYRAAQKRNDGFKGAK